MVNVMKCYFEIDSFNSTNHLSSTRTSQGDWRHESFSVLTSHGHFHLTWPFSSSHGHSHLAWTFSPYMAISHTMWPFSPCLCIFTSHGHFSPHVASTIPKSHITCNLTPRTCSHSGVDTHLTCPCHQAESHFVCTITWQQHLTSHTPCVFPSIQK